MVGIVKFGATEAVQLHFSNNLQGPSISKPVSIGSDIRTTIIAPNVGAVTLENIPTAKKLPLNELSLKNAANEARNAKLTAYWERQPGGTLDKAIDVSSPDGLAQAQQLFENYRSHLAAKVEAYRPHEEFQIPFAESSREGEPVLYKSPTGGESLVAVQVPRQAIKLDYNPLYKEDPVYVTRSTAEFLKGLTLQSLQANPVTMSNATRNLAMYHAQPLPKWSDFLGDIKNMFFSSSPPVSQLVNTPRPR